VKHSKTIVLMITAMSVITGTLESPACTSFMLKTDQGLYFVHSLNQGSWERVPGIIFINQRDTWKKGYSWESLIRVIGDSPPGLVWRSQYGSVTFNPLGKEFPDGGMNEAGLFIWEMSFDDTEYPRDEYKPMLFQMQWMQYQLDNFKSIDEVIDNAGRMAIDGWGWHYFVADASGRAAIIDFVSGKPVVYSGADLPLPICCNSSYPEAMTWLEQHEGFGGELPITQNFNEIPRFIYGAKLMQEFSTQDPVDYGFHMLDAMSTNVRWSVVFDVSNMTVFFKTNVDPAIRHFAFTDSDFGRKDGPLMLDIEHPGPENIRHEFVPYDGDMNRKLLGDILAEFCKEPELRQALLEDQGTDIAGLVQAMDRKVQTPDASIDFSIQGEWVGKAEYPAGDAPMELPMSLTLGDVRKNLSGTVNDDVLIKNLAMTNIDYAGGLLNFTIHHPETGDVLYYELHASAAEMRGRISILGKQKRGSVSLTRKTPAGQ